MVYYDRIGVSEGIDVYKTKECDICHYWNFLDIGFKFQSDVCNGCHVLMMSMSLGDIAILNIHGADYCCIISGVSKSETINLIHSI